MLSSLPPSPQNRLHFPYIYNEEQTHAQSRQDFKDFFSCLTNIRCVVVEGGHHCEAASQILQGYQLGDPIPLKQFGLEVSQNSTRFQLSPTVVHFCQDKDIQFDRSVLDDLNLISEKITEQKTYVVELTWHDFFKRVSEDINEHNNFELDLYNSSEDFHLENATARNTFSLELKSNKFKQFLHEILTNAIFEYSPCKDLIDNCNDKYKPNCNRWARIENKWVTLSADPYQQVSKIQICTV